MNFIKKWIRQFCAALKKIRTPHWRAKSNYIKYFDTLSLDEKAILLESEHGKKLDGNIFYVARHLATSPEYADYKIYFASWGRFLSKFRTFLESHGMERIQLVTFSSDEYFRLLASAKYLINDTTFGPNFIKKEGQIYLNTWHGTPLKTLGKKDNGGYHALGNVQKNFVCSDYLLFPNEHTRDCLIEDYMLENISEGCSVLGGYPRNEIFFDTESRRTIRETLGLEDVKVYAYMPTYRGDYANKKENRSFIYLFYYLFEIDKSMGENEVFYVNLHPLAQKNLNFSEFKHLRPFPKEYETYEFLNVADVLITDYSSVFFDFVLTQQKIVLFTYDKEEYFAERGLYMPMESLPFPQVADVPSLMAELRSEKQYDEAGFLQKFCAYECADASARLLDFVLLNKNTGLTTEPIPANGKENVLIYAGNLAANGITTSLRSLLNTIDLNKRNYYISFMTGKVKNNRENLLTFPKGVQYFPLTGDMNLTITERILRKLFKEKILTANLYMKWVGKRVHQDLSRTVGTTKFDRLIQFNGYEQEVILRYSSFDGPNVIFVHNDMTEEIRSRGNQRSDVLRYAYSHYDKVAVVTEDIMPPTKKISRRHDNLQVVRNTIPYDTILSRAEEELQLDPFTISSGTPEETEAFFQSSGMKFINVARFSPEKGQFRLVDAFARLAKDHPDARLLIMGGNSYQGYYEKLLAHVQSLNLSDKILLLQKVSNPYPVIKACDAFVLSSFYEGFGLVLVEADILGKPVISTDIVGPRLFMQQHGGTLVEDSEEGIYHGLNLLYEGKIAPMGVDYASYNQEAAAEFEALFD